MSVTGYSDDVNPKNICVFILDKSLVATEIGTDLRLVIRRFMWMRELIVHLAIHLVRMPEGTLVCDAAGAATGKPVLIYEGKDCVPNKNKFVLALDSIKTVSRVFGTSDYAIMSRIDGRTNLPIPGNNYGGGATQLFAVAPTDESYVISSQDDAHDIFMSKAGYETPASRLDTNKSEWFQLVPNSNVVMARRPGTTQPLVVWKSEVDASIILSGGLSKSYVADLRYQGVSLPVTIHNHFGSPYRGLEIDFVPEEELLVGPHSRLMAVDNEAKVEALKEFHKPISLEDEMEDGGETWTCQHMQCRQRGNQHLVRGRNDVPNGFIVPVTQCPGCKKHRLGGSKKKCTQMRQAYIEANFVDQLERVPGSSVKWQRRTM